MVLSFFGKKPGAGERAAAEKPSEDDKKPPAPPAELSTLDFSAGGDFGRALAQCADAINVQEVGDGQSSVAEDAAVLYANGSDDEAEKVLASVLDDPAQPSGEGLWLMLLDLYRLTGQRALFESKVLDYATRFEKSPPPWEDLSNQMAVKKKDSSPLVNLGGTLGGEAQTQFTQILNVGRKSAAVRIDLSRLRGITPEGSTLFRNTLKQLSKEKIRVQLFGTNQLTSLLQTQIEAGSAENEDSWLLMLTLLQYAGDMERFEEMAVDYAVTFEVSPPSWDAALVPPPAAAAAPTPAETEADDHGLRFEGEINASNVDVIRNLAAAAAPLSAVHVDCSTLRRIDFVSAGTLFNVLAGLQGQGKLVVLHNVNGMVAGLLRVMGVDQVAQVLLRP